MTARRDLRTSEQDWRTQAEEYRQRRKLAAQKRHERERQERFYTIAFFGMTLTGLVIVLFGLEAGVL